MSNVKSSPGHLAWHETLELHELTAFQANALVGFKSKLGAIPDPALKALYAEAIRNVETNLRELLRFYPQAPSPQHRKSAMPEPAAAEAGQLLGFAKTSVRNYAIAITETATPQLRETFRKQLLLAIGLHEKVFNYMYERGMYPAYDLGQLLANDVRNANAALEYKAT